MAKTFQMGAKMTLKDQFKSSISKIIDATQEFKKNVDSANKSVDGFKESNSRLHDELGKYANKSKQAKKDSDGLKASMNGLANVAGMVKKAFAALGISAAFKQAKSWLVDASADMETYKNTLAVVLKSEQQAVKTLAWAQEFATKTPFELPQIIEATTRMTAYGMSAEKTLGIVGDMASVMGKDLMQAVEAIADAQTGGLERLKEFGITKTMIEEQAKAMKLTVTNNQGQIVDQKAFNAALFKLMEDRYQGGMEIQSKTLKGMVSNFQDYVATIGRELGKPLFEKVKEGLASIMAKLDQLEADGTLQRIITRIQDIGTVVFQVGGKIVAFAREVITNIVNRVVAWYNNNKPLIDKVGQAFKTAFTKLAEFAGPIINWLKDEGIPGLIDAIGTVGTWVLKVAGWFSDNWGTIKPIILGIAAAWGTYFAITKTIQIATKVWTAIQWALNAAMNANPIGLIITAIGVLIGLIILLVQNWDTVKTVLISIGQAIADFFVNVWNGIKSVAITVWNAIVGAVIAAWNFIKGTGQAIGNFFVTIWNAIKGAAISVWNGITGAFNSACNWVTGAFINTWNFIKGIGQGIGDFFTGIWTGIGNAVTSVVTWITGAWQDFKTFFSDLWDGIIGVVKAPINFLISAVNTIIRGLNTVSIDIPDWVPLVGGKTFGFKIPEIPYLAKGTNNWMGGPAFMNERGGELAVLPGGSKVIPADKTDKILERPSGPIIHIDKLVDKIEIHQQPGEDAESFATRVITVLYEKLSTAAEIANNDEMGALVNG